jgi:hypothetical protein
MYFIASSWVTCQEASLEHAIFFPMRWFLLRGGSWKGLGSVIYQKRFFWKQFHQINAQKFVTLMRRNSLLNAKKGVTQCTDFRYINAQKIVT